MKWLSGRAERAEAEAAATAGEQRERARRTGDTLRQARTERGITLADVEQDIRINHTYIDALENARFDLLPAPVYARGFMRSYARYLGLDPDEALRAVPGDLPRPSDLDPMPGLRRATPTAFPTFATLNRPIAISAAVVVALVAAAALLAPRFVGSTGGGTDAAPAATSTAQVDIVAPDLVGATREGATAALERADLTPLVFESPNAAPAGTVFRQAPAGGAAVKRGDVITLFVSQGAAGASPTSTPSR